MINIKNFDPNQIKIDQKSDKNIDIYYIGCITVNDHVNNYTVNPLHFIIDKVGGYIEEDNGNKYLIFFSTDKNKEVLAKYRELWNKNNI